MVGSVSISPTFAILLRWRNAWNGEGFSPLELVLSEGRFYLPSDPICPLPLHQIDFDRAIHAIPGSVDFHVHINEKMSGYDLADDFSAYARLAQRSGIQAIAAFITESSDSDLVSQYRRYEAAAKKHFGGFVRWHLTPIHSSLREIEPLLRIGCDLKFYTTYRSAGLYRSYDEIGRWMGELSDLKPRMLVHSEDDNVVTEASERHPFTHPRKHSLRRPPEAEIKAVDRLCDLSVRYNYPLHIVHVSTPQAARIIQSAKSSAPISCETSANYLFLNEDIYDQPDGHRWLFTPPLRSENMRGELRDLAQDGIFDIYATDHCPFSRVDKDRYRNELDRVPCGIAGSGALMPLLLDKLGVSPEHIITRICDNPARLMNMGDDYRQLKPADCARFIMFSQIVDGDGICSANTDETRTIGLYMPSLSDTYNPWEKEHTRSLIHHSIDIPGKMSLPTNPVVI